MRCVAHEPQGLEDYVDYMCRGKVTHVFFCVAGQRTSYDSRTWEPIWKGLDEPARPDTAMAADGTHDRWAVNAKTLFDAGVDPYAVWIARCRTKGVSPWISLRMNDVHGCDMPGYFRLSSFYKAHPEWRLDPSGTNASWFQNQLDYARREVRDYHLAQVREIAVRWPADGVELDWMRFGHVFRLGEERANAHLLDAFMREASGAIRASGKRVAVRVPYDPDLCAEYGFNVLSWAQEGLVDVVIPAPFIKMTSELPVTRWRQALEGANVRLVPDLGCEVPVAERTSVPKTYRRVAKRFISQGADGVYLYNLPYKSDARYSSDACGKAWCPTVDVAAELYAGGLSDGGETEWDVGLPCMPADWPYPEMRHDVVPAGRDGPALQAAIDRASSAGGGRVVLTNGIYERATLYLKSNVKRAAPAVNTGDGWERIR